MDRKSERRQYYKGAPLDAAGEELTLKGWLGEEPDVAAGDIKQVLETDVIVIGAGTAGVCAARGSVEEGARTVLIEKTKTVQARSGEFGVIGFSNVLNEKYGMDYSEYKDKIVQEFTKQCTYRNSHRLLKRWADECGGTFDWYWEGKPDLYVCPDTLSPAPAEHKFWLQPTRYPQPVRYKPLDELYPVFPGTVRFAPSHLPTLQGNWDIAEATGLLTTLFRTRVIRMLREDGGRVTGVVAQSYEDDSYIQVNCSKGIVVCTGGYGGNYDMLDYYTPWARYEFSMPVSMDERKLPGNIGDGHRMGMWIGAKIQDGPHALIDHAMGSALMGCTPYLAIDKNGERFMNEETTGQQWGTQINRLKDHVAYQIFDSAWPEQIEFMPSGHAIVVGQFDDDQEYPNGVQRYNASDSYTTPSQLDGNIEGARKRGDFAVKCDTLDELIDALPLSDSARETARASIERYNELAKRGCDEDFYKHASRLFPIEKAPFYAAQLNNAGIIDALGGLDSDHEMRVRDENLDIIPGLYAAGNSQGNRFIADYPMVLPGISHSSCITFGRIAGRNCANGI